jgi:hypothetical protein
MFNCQVSYTDPQILQKGAEDAEPIDDYGGEPPEEDDPFSDGDRD